MTTKSMVGWLALSLAAAGVARAQEGGAGPSIEHNPVTQAQAQQPLTLTATIHSSNGVFQPVVDFRHEGETSWTKIPLLPSGGSVYSATVPGASLSANIEYYLEAYDNDGNGPARAGGPDAPFHVVVATPARQVTAQTPTPTAAPAKGDTGTEKKSGSMGKTIGGIAGLAVGVAGIGVGIFGWVQRGQEIGYSNAASPSERFVYQSPISNDLVLGIVGLSVGVAAAGVGAWLLWSGLTSGPSSAAAPSKDDSSGGFSLVPVPGGAMAGYAGRF